MKGRFGIIELRKLIRLLERGAGRPVRCAEFRRELIDLVSAMGLDGSNTFGPAGLSTAEQNKQHGAEAEECRRISVDDDPLAAANRLRASITRTRFFSGLRGWYLRVQRRHKEAIGSRQLEQIPWQELVELTSNDREPASEYVRNKAEELARFSLSQIERGRPKDDQIDTLMRQLAILYASYTDYSFDHYELPHSIGSRFIKFVQRIIHKLFPFQASPTSLARRWNRLKQHQKSGTVSTKASRRQSSASKTTISGPNRRRRATKNS